ncbi:MAG: hypothetical protein PVJ09_00035 [Candidatus Woesebacteria bacterium]|jgi:hypothetical protein
MKKIAILATTLLSFAFVCQQALADRMESASYIIQFGNFNITAGEKESSSYKVTDTVGQTGAGPYGSLGSSTYFVGGGFQYIYPFEVSEFNFSISNTSIDLGVLTPGFHNSASNQIAVQAVGTAGYSVYAFETRALTHQDGVESIPDTSCDLGTCTESQARVWVNQNVPGFGFNISGDDVVSDFVSSNYFRQFANNNLGETMQRIMGATTIDGERTADITYKAGISGSQAAGNYQTEIIFIAVPGY